LNTLETTTPSPVFKLVLVTLLTGVMAGCGGMVLALLLHYLQHLAFGYSPDAIISDESFLTGVSHASAMRRIVVLSLCGVIAGCGWYLLYRFGKPLVSIAAAVKAPRPAMPILSTVIHALLQIITVALGSPLGREVAPREIGSVSANWLADCFQLTARETQIMVACGAGAGLAAVYNVPLGGAVFTLEVLLGGFSWQLLLPAIATSSIAALVAWIGLGNESQYHLPALNITPALMVWSVICGPIFGLAAYGFTRLTSYARSQAPRRATLPILSLINFVLVGVLAVWLPQLLGNGKGPAQLSFDNQLTLQFTLVLLCCKVLVIWGSLRSGAQGGLLTPGLSNGALLACLLGIIWNSIWPGTSLGAFAIVGATAFLASSMKMPITAIVLLLEFTHINHDFIIPMLFAVMGSVATFHWLSRSK
jgi:H+/Cl- antiporter ClcA